MNNLFMVRLNNLNKIERRNFSDDGFNLLQISGFKVLESRSCGTKT